MSSSPELTPMLLFMSSETSSILATCQEQRRKLLDQEVCWPHVNLAKERNTVPGNPVAVDGMCLDFFE